ncbi:MAG: hypothetical protein KC636_11115, partial [Myxococcales bacterium]|nr:hypothetical protein [Myxococcales bacterium]
SPDGARLATASSDESARVWDASTGELVVALHGHTGDLTDIAFAPDGRHLATASEDHTVKIWDPVTGELVHDLTDRVGLRQQDGSLDWPIPPQALTRVGCTRLRPFVKEYAQVVDICEPLLEGH